MYLISSYYRSPIYITHPNPVGYVHTLKEAKKVCEEKNRRAVSNEYFYIKLKEVRRD